MHPAPLALLAACANPEPTVVEITLEVPVATSQTTPPAPSSDRDGDGTPDASDCAPDDAAVHPGANEACNAVDDDCDGAVDEDFDADGDGWLLDHPLCDGVPSARDCDDGDPETHPGAAEICDGEDDDCNGLVDDPGDADGDGANACDDCDDHDPGRAPGMPELCDGIDNDCSGLPDEPYDDDGDGASECGLDCDDTNPYVSDHLPEVCDGADNDCDDEVDEDFDLDGDGQATCEGDCDDGDPDVYAGAEELCDGIDNDCDPMTAEEADLDKDGFTACTGGDCDDLDPDAFPGGTETCDGADNDCNGFVDEDVACFDCHEQGRWLVCLQTVSYTEHLAACLAVGATPAVITSGAENAEAAAAALAWTGASPWIGLDDIDVEGTFAWWDGTPVTYTSWGSGEPNDWGGEDCAAINYGGTGKWNDWPESQQLPFLCELGP